MNNIKNILIYFIAIITFAQISGCGKTEATKLLYGSRKTIGVQLDRGVDGSPIPSVNVGYADHDIALVPVAIVYNLDKDVGSSKEKIQLIWGRSCEDENSSSSSCNGLTSNGRFDYKINLKDAVEQCKNKNIDIDESAIRNALDGISSNTYFYDNEALFSLNDSDLSPEQSIIESLKSEGVQLNDSNATKDILKASIQAINAVIREDAFSVFGSFTGKVKADDKGVGLAVGKIFATGVAAQTIAKGSADALRNHSGNSCLMILQEVGKFTTTLTGQQLIDLCNTSAGAATDIAGSGDS